MRVFQSLLALGRRVEDRLNTIIDQQEKTMAAIQTVADYTKQINDNLTKLGTAIGALDSDIQVLQTKIAGGLSPSDAALLQAVVDQSAALVTQAAVPPPPAPPAPPVP